MAEPGTQYWSRSKIATTQISWVIRVLFLSLFRPSRNRHSAILDISSERFGTGASEQLLSPNSIQLIKYTALLKKNYGGTYCMESDLCLFGCGTFRHDSPSGADSFEGHRLVCQIRPERKLCPICEPTIEETDPVYRYWSRLGACRKYLHPSTHPSSNRTGPTRGWIDTTVLLWLFLSRNARQGAQI